MQADAQPAGVFNVIWITVTMLVLLSNLVLIKKKHTAGLSISWNVLFCIQVLVVLLHVILVPSAQVTLPARALRDTASEVGVCPLPFYCAPICIYASYPPHPTQPHPPQPLPAIQFYEMAAKDKVCGNNLVARWRHRHGGAVRGGRGAAALRWALWCWAPPPCLPGRGLVAQEQQLH